MRLVSSTPSSKPAPESIKGFLAAISQSDLRAVVEQISVPRPTCTPEKISDPHESSLGLRQVGAEVEPWLPPWFVVRAALIPPDVRAIRPVASGQRSRLRVAMNGVLSGVLSTQRDDVTESYLTCTDLALRELIARWQALTPEVRAAIMELVGYR
jgi:hypothetical protein